MSHLFDPQVTTTCVYKYCIPLCFLFWRNYMFQCRIPQPWIYFESWGIIIQFFFWTFFIYLEFCFGTALSCIFSSLSFFFDSPSLSLRQRSFVAEMKCNGFILLLVFKDWSSLLQHTEHQEKAENAAAFPPPQLLGLSLQLILAGTSCHGITIQRGYSW